MSKLYQIFLTLAQSSSDNKATKQHVMYFQFCGWSWWSGTGDADSVCSQSGSRSTAQGRSLRSGLSCVVIWWLWLFDSAVFCHCWLVDYEGHLACKI